MMAKREGTAAGAAKKTVRKKTAARKSAAPRGRAGADVPDLRTDMREFASARPEGWDHSDWLSFLDHLKERGHDTSSPDDIGRQLERERLAVVLSGVRSLGPKRVEGLVGRFDTLWSMRRADVDEIAAVPGMNRSLAEKVRQAML